MKTMYLAAILTAVLPLAPPASTGTPPAATGTGLPALESRVESAYSVAAAAAAAKSAGETLDQVTAQSGWKYIFSNAVGPRADQVTQVGPRSKYVQNLGFSSPIFGSRSQEKDQQADAVRDRQDAIAELTDARRTALAALRGGYVGYWQAQQLADLARTFLHHASTEERPVRSLVRAGFWTEADLLGFEETVRHVQNDALTAQTTAVTQLAAMRSVIGPLDRFPAPKPAFVCIHNRTSIIEGSEKTDLQIAEIDAQLAQLRTSLPYVKHSAATGSVSITAGTSLDAPTANNPTTVAYSLNVGTSVSMPVHGRSEERDQRAALEASIQQQTDLRLQRERDIESAVDAGMDAVDLAQTQLAYSKTIAADKAEALRVAIVRFKTQRQTTHPLYADILAAEADKYTADQAVVTAEGDLASSQANLASVAPIACTTE